MGTLDTLQFLSWTLLFALEAFGMQAQFSTIQWFRIAIQPLETPFTKTEILNNMAIASYLSVHGETVDTRTEHRKGSTCGHWGSLHLWSVQECSTEPPPCALPLAIVTSHSDLTVYVFHASISCNPFLFRCYMYRLYTLCFSVFASVPFQCRHTINVVSPIYYDKYATMFKTLLCKQVMQSAGVDL